MIDFKAFREDNKLTQVMAAAYFGCKQSFISQIESGYRPVPDTFISKVLSDISMDGTHMTPDDNEVMTEPVTEVEQTVPAKFVEMLFEERKNHDLKELELLSQNRELIDLLKSDISDIKKTISIVHEASPAACAIASGSGLVR